MKNPVNDVIDSYADHDYTDEVDRDFRDWLTDPAHAGEKESGLQRLWMRTEADDTPGFDQSTCAAPPVYTRAAASVCSAAGSYYGAWRQW